jgi:hypothetical protein
VSCTCRALARRVSCAPSFRAAAANLGTHAVLLAPVLIDNHAAGVVEVWLGPATDAPMRKALARFLAAVVWPLCYNSIRVPSTFRNAASHAG